MAIPTTDRAVLLRDQVYREVSAAIKSGKLRPGDIISEGSLAREYHVSKTPVREALCMLAFQRLLSPLPRTGYLVTSISVRDVQESHHLRQILECEAVRLASERIGALDLRQLEASMNSETGSEALGMNREFHLTIARASGSQRLVSLIDQLLDEMERMQALDPHLATPSGPYEHAEIVDALKRRDPQAAQDAMRRHVEGAMARILERF